MSVYFKMEPHADRTSSKTKKKKNQGSQLVFFKFHGCLHIGKKIKVSKIYNILKYIIFYHCSCVTGLVLLVDNPRRGLLIEVDWPTNPQ